MADLHNLAPEGPNPWLDSEDDEESSEDLGPAWLQREDGAAWYPWMVIDGRDL